MPGFIQPEDRIDVLASYYQVSRELIQQLARIPPSQRKDTCRQHGVDPYILRTMMDYTRYPEAVMLHQALIQKGARVQGMSILDFGCLVADYSVHFSRFGAQVAVYDTEAVTKFVLFRLAREGKTAQTYFIPGDYAAMAAGKNLVVFGEVLEHMFDPLQALQACVAQKVDYIFTTCFPYGDDKYFALPGHRKAAQEQQPACIELLSQGYHRHPLLKKAVLWQRIAPKKDAA